MNARKQGLFLGIILPICVAGFLASGYLALNHYRSLSGEKAGASFCSVSETIDCDLVSESPYAEIAGIPLASIGAGVYLLLISFSLYGLLLGEPARIRALRSIRVISALAVVLDIYLAIIGAFVLKTLCIVCVFTYAVNLANLLLSGKALSEPVRRSLSGLLRFATLARSETAGQDRVLTAMYHALNGVVAASCIALIGLLQWHYFGGDDIVAQKIMRRMKRDGPVAVRAGKAPFTGRDGAPLKIVEFSDFDCPYCKKMAASLKTVFNRYDGKIQLFFKHYPLNRKCNPRIRGEFHKLACVKAYLSVCAGAQGAFWKIHDDLFEWKGGDPRDFMQRLSELGVDMPALKSCLAGQRPLEAVREDVEQARTLGISSTPTLFVNGHRLVGYLKPNVLRLILDAFLKEPPGGK